jgi:amino acid transporter
MSDFGIFQLLGFSGTGIVATLSVLGIFWKADDAFSDEFRDALSKKLQGMKIEPIDVNWSEGFEKIFDRAFGRKHFSWNCFVRSCIASILAVILLSALSLSIQPSSFEFSSNVIQAFLAFLVVFIALNLIPDYFSLLETRWIIGLITRQHSTTFVLILLFLDFILTIAIFFLVATVLLWLFLLLLNFLVILHGKTIGEEALAQITITNIPVLFSKSLIKQGIYLKVVSDFPVSIGVFLYSTFFTSVWVWLTIIGWFFVRNAARIQTVLSVLQFILPIKTKPMRAIGEVAAMVTAIVFVLFGFFGVDFEPAKESALGYIVMGQS